ncbi:MAG TPA: CBS domain-containing protein [Gemmatimonadales bacterium]|jgi:signal-transduction protein with cAMP-binding, CBS, and nucleotidyltransferase domain
MSVGRICSRVVATASGSETVRTAAARMAEHEVGTLVVVGTSHPRQAIGILTDRDLAVRCIAGRWDPDATVISAVMTSPVQSVDEHVPIADAVAMMARSGTRRLVVTGEDNRVVGLLSLDDVLGVAVEEAGAIGQLLEQQKPRIPA